MAQLETCHEQTNTHGGPMRVDGTVTYVRFYDRSAGGAVSLDFAKL